MVTPDKPKNLIQKLIDVMAAVDRIPKNGFNEHFKYYFAQEADVKEALRTELVKANILLVSSIVGSQQNGSVTTIQTSHTFMDGDSDREVTVMWSSQGQDTQDKGVSKAATSALKYMLLNNFLVPTGDDPDAAGATRAPRQRESAPTAVQPNLREQAQQTTQRPQVVAHQPVGVANTVSGPTPIGGGLASMLATVLGTANDAQWRWFYATLKRDLDITYEQAEELLGVESMKKELPNVTFGMVIQRCKDALAKRAAEA